MRIGRLKEKLTGLAVAALVMAPHVAAYAEPRRGEGFGYPHDASEYGFRIDRMINFTTYCISALFLIMCAWMAVTFVLHNRKHTAEYNHGNSMKGVAFAAAIAGFIFFFVDGTLFWNSYHDLEEVFWNFEGAEKDPKAIRVQVNAHQWAWDMRQAGADGKFGTPDDIVMLNELRVPVGTTIYLQLASTDVIHSFYLPNFRVKQDAVPGMVTRLRFESKETGEFDIACAQHCGTNHYKMKALLTVMSQEDYSKWVGEASALAEKSYDADDATGHWAWSWQPAK